MLVKSGECNASFRTTNNDNDDLDIRWLIDGTIVLLLGCEVKGCRIAWKWRKGKEDMGAGISRLEEILP